MIKNIIGRQSLGREPFGRMGGRSRKNIIAKVRRKMEQWRDNARRKLLEARRRYKFKVERNEASMRRKKLDREKNLNPSVVALMPSQKYAKKIRNPSNWSSVSAKPKYSKVKPRKRIYGKRWKLLEEGKEI